MKKTDDILIGKEWVIPSWFCSTIISESFEGFIKNKKSVSALKKLLDSTDDACKKTLKFMESINKRTKNL